MPPHDEDEKLPGRRWRVLAHAPTETVELENRGVFDELVVDDWLHLEQMDTHQWCLRVGDARVWVSIDGEAQPQVDIQRGFYNEVRGNTKTV